VAGGSERRPTDTPAARSKGETICRQQQRPVLPGGGGGGGGKSNQSFIANALGVQCSVFSV